MGLSEATYYRWKQLYGGLGLQSCARCTFHIPGVLDTGRIRFMGRG